ncbi:MAG: hypothetical protein ACJARD_000556 [Alphaproteobacteria bacterium]|jgi:hypothetical protein
MIIANDKAFEYKGIALDLPKIIFDASQDNLADLIEIFRLEGFLVPIILKQPIISFHDASYDRLHSTWSRFSKNEFEKKLPPLSHLPIAVLRALGTVKISFQDTNTNNFYYIDYKKYTNNEGIHYTDSTKNTITNSGSPNAILYHVVNSVCLLRSDILYTLHYTKVPNIAFQGWYGMHIPFSNTKNNAPSKGVVSLMRKI